MTQKVWLKAIDKNSITSSDLLLIADLCGIDVAVSLLKNASGLCINIPKDGFRTAKRKYILDNYTGTSVSSQFAATFLTIG